MAQQAFFTIVGGWPTITNPGSMQHPVSILANGPTSPPTIDESGVVFAWTVFAQTVAFINAMRGRDVIMGGQTTTQLFLEVGIWFMPGVLPNMRVQTENGSQYVIQSVENVLEKNQILVLNCLGIGVND